MVALEWMYAISNDKLWIKLNVIRCEYSVSKYIFRRMRIKYQYIDPQVYYSIERNNLIQDTHNVWTMKMKMLIKSIDLEQNKIL